VYELFIANKNYSSWSLRPWALLSELGIPFNETLLIFGEEAAWDSFRRVSPAGKVPCLRDGATVVWDSLAITEYLAERHAGVWPADGVARAWARSAAAEMHSGFGELRHRCSMSVGVRVRLHARPPALDKELARLTALWGQGLERFGGPFLAGAAFTAVDAFFAPVAFRLQTYGLSLGDAADAYAARLRALSSMQAWYAAALAERARDAPHEAEIQQAGEWLADLRAT
jgi:glutathione S-transferase